MSTWRKELQGFECADHQDRDANRGEPRSRIGKSKREPNQDESERMLNVLTEIRMRSVLRGARVAKVTATASSQANKRRTIVIPTA